MSCRFGPIEHAFSVPEVSDELTFSQFLGEVRGSISCLEQCAEISVLLRSLQCNDKPRTAVLKDGAFGFEVLCSTVHSH